MSKTRKKTFIAEKIKPQIYDKRYSCHIFLFFVRGHSFSDVWCLYLISKSRASDILAFCILDFTNLGQLKWFLEVIGF